MKKDEYSTMFEFEKFYWWYVARRKVIEFLIREAMPDGADQILDAGCGTGGNSEILKKFGDGVYVDLFTEALEHCKSRGLKKLVQSSLKAMSFASNQFDLVTSLDVLEHVDEDLVAMRELHRITKPGGVAIIAVPAYGFLWSEHDEALHHYRRYSPYELRNKLTSVGFDVERQTHFITFLFVPILIVRILQNIFKRRLTAKTSHIILPRWVNSTLVCLLSIECFLLKFINLPIGVSLLCIARKPR